MTGRSRRIREFHRGFRGGKREVRGSEEDRRVKDQGRWL
jgi:hypothetical protein